MKKLISITSVLMAIIISSDAQEISKSKTVSIANIKAAGYEVKYFPDENKFAYVRFDNFGKAVVGFDYTGDVVRRVSFLCEKPDMAPKMLLDVLAHIPLAELGKPQQDHGIWDKN